MNPRRESGEREWNPIPTASLPDPGGIRFVRPLSPGRWLLGGDGAMLAVYDLNGIGDLARGSDESVVFEMASGDWEDLAVVVTTRPGDPPALMALTGRRWLRSLPLPEVSHVTGLARIGDSRWMVAGRDLRGTGYLGLYDPLHWSIERIATPGVRSFLACSADASRGLGVAVGTNAATVWVDAKSIEVDPGSESSSLATVSLDESGRALAALTGSIRMRAGSHAPWQELWSSASWRAPIISVMSGVGRVVALTVDGGVVEGTRRG